MNTGTYFLKIEVDMPGQGSFLFSDQLGHTDARKFERAVMSMDAYGLDSGMSTTACKVQLRLVHESKEGDTEIVWGSTPKSTWDEARAELFEKMRAEPTYNMLAGR